jgi:hypothetical protein
VTTVGPVDQVDLMPVTPVAESPGAMTHSSRVLQLKGALLCSLLRA